MHLTPLGLILWGPVAVAVGLHETLWVASALLVVSNLAMLAVADIRRVGWAPGAR